MSEKDKELQKIIAIVGPTASGKTSWSLRLAEEIGGEIISADSRQIYQKMTIGTAKVPGEWKWTGLRRTYLVNDIPHHLVDFLDPGKVFTVAEFRDKALKYVRLAESNGHIPIVVGGTGLYVEALIDNYSIPRVNPNKKLRESLEHKSVEELIALLKQMDPETAEKIDAKNKRRLIRALEVCIFTGEPFSAQRQKGESLFDALLIGIDVPRDMLYQRIDERVDEMMKQGLEKEIRALIKQKYSWDLPSMNGIGYKEMRSYIEGKESLEHAVSMLKRDTRRLARKQLTWFRRDKRIIWVSSYAEAKALVEKFLGLKSKL